GQDEPLRAVPPARGGRLPAQEVQVCDGRRGRRRGGQGRQAEDRRLPRPPPDRLRSAWRSAGSRGHGIKGVVCYEGERITDGARVAIKWPARKAEVTTLQEIHRKAPKDSPGLPRLLSSGVHEQEPYLVSELLGSSLTRVFQRLEAGT
ncbi:unnamed protein product, partial [Prorocentrum cordatum]